MLLDLAATLPQPDLQDAAIASLASLGGLGNHEDLAPTLNQAWRTSGNTNLKLLRNVSFAMAQVGAASSIELLLSSALDPSGLDESHRQAARNALASADIVNDDAVQPLAARLSNDTPTNEGSKLASATLMSMQGAPATRALLAWMQTAVSSPFAHDLAAHTQDPEVWQAAMNPAVPFRSESNREAIRKGLADHKAGIVFVPAPKPEK